MSQTEKEPAELAKQLREEEPVLRREAAGYLARLAEDDPDAVANELFRLQDALTDDDPETGEHVGNALVALATDDPERLLGQETLEQLQRAIRTGNERVKRKVTIVFSEIANTDPEPCVEFVPEIAKMCRSKDEPTRYYAVAFLIDMASACLDAVYEAISELHHVLEYDDKDAGDLVFKVLGTVGEQHPDLNYK